MSSEAKQSLRRAPMYPDEVFVSDVELWGEANVRHREVTEGIDELAANIKEIGLLQAPIVQKLNGKYRLIVGQRRFEAIKQLGWKKMPVMVLREPYDLTHAKLVSLSENLHRKPAVAGDLADACDYLIKETRSITKVAKLLGISEVTVRKYYGYKGVPEGIKKLVEKHIISVSDALRLSRIEADVSKAIEFARFISKLPKPARERHFLAFMENPSASLSSIRSRAEQFRYKNVVRIYLPETYAHALAKASADRDEEPESILQFAAIQWLQSSGYVTEK